jgi:hypothetical protein
MLQAQLCLEKWQFLEDLVSLKKYSVYRPHISFEGQTEKRQNSINFLDLTIPEENSLNLKYIE